jgi:hypothetical protein
VLPTNIPQIVVQSKALEGLSGTQTAIIGTGADGDAGVYYIEGLVQKALLATKDGIQIVGLPTSNPGKDGVLYSDGGTLKISSG